MKLVGFVKRIIQRKKRMANGKKQLPIDSDAMTEPADSAAGGCSTAATEEDPGEVEVDACADAVETTVKGEDEDDEEATVECSSSEEKGAKETDETPRVTTVTSHQGTTEEIDDIEDDEEEDEEEEEEEEDQFHDSMAEGHVNIGIMSNKSMSDISTQTPSLHGASQSMGDFTSELANHDGGVGVCDTEAKNTNGVETIVKQSAKVGDNNSPSGTSTDVVVAVVNDTDAKQEEDEAAPVAKEGMEKSDTSAEDQEEKTDRDAVPSTMIEASKTDQKLAHTQKPSTSPARKGRMHAKNVKKGMNTKEKDSDEDDDDMIIAKSKSLMDFSVGGGVQYFVRTSRSMIEGGNAINSKPPHLFSVSEGDECSDAVPDTEASQDDNLLQEDDEDEEADETKMNNDAPESAGEDDVNGGSMNDSDHKDTVIENSKSMLDFTPAATMGFDMLVRASLSMMDFAGAPPAADNNATPADGTEGEGEDSKRCDDEAEGNKADVADQVSNDENPASGDDLVRTNSKVPTSTDDVNGTNEKESSDAAINADVLEQPTAVENSGSPDAADSPCNRAIAIKRSKSDIGLKKSRSNLSIKHSRSNLSTKSNKSSRDSLLVKPCKSNVSMKRTGSTVSAKQDKTCA